MVAAPASSPFGPSLLTLDGEEEQPRGTFKRILIFALLALLLHLTFLVTAHWLPFETKPKERVAVENWDASKLSELKKAWNKEKQKPLVLGKDLPASKETPKNARYSSDKNHEVEKEMRAAQTDVLPKAGSPGSATQAQQAQQNPTKREQAQKHPFPSLSQLGVGIPRPVTPEERQELEKRENQQTRSAQNGSSGADQALKDDRLSVGAENMLNTQEAKYYSFYARLYQIIAPNWQSEIRRISTFKRVAPGSYTTAADIVLDEQGTLVEVRIEQSSGVTEFDEAVGRAWGKIGKFPNPPRALLDEKREVHTGWTFNVDVDANFNLIQQPPTRNY